MMAHKQNYCSSPNFCLAFLSLFLLMRHTCTYGYNIGTEVTLDFHHEFSSQESSFFCLISLEGTPEPFFHQNKINLRGLRPGQAGRVGVILEQSQINVIIHITIQDLQRIDEGLYIVTIYIETTDGKVTPHLYDTFVYVTYPPGQAVCRIRNPPLPTENWLVVSCNATLGNDDSGYLKCFQNSNQAPPYRQPVRHVHNVIADFWIDSMKEVHCCSAYNASDIDPESCNDFVNTPIPAGSLTSYRPDHNAPKEWIPTSPSSTDDGSTPHHGNTSQQIVTIVTMAVTFAVIIIIL